MSSELTQPPTNFFTREQLATRWGCSISTLKRREKSGELKPTRLGPRILRYEADQILKFEKSQTSETQPLSPHNTKNNDQEQSSTKNTH